MRLLSRSVDETDHDVRDAIAKCLGEIGAINPNRLGKDITSSQFVNDSMENGDGEEWRLSQPPWKSHTTRYQLRLVTRHLVVGLKSSPTALDQHKISFAIQELLQLLNAFAIKAGATEPANVDDDTCGGSKAPMSMWLKGQLEEADVFKVVEPFWTTTYKQSDIASKSPPFFVKSNSYYAWISSFCRFLVTKSFANDKSLWRHLFYACRSAIRSPSGISVAEFLFPVLVLDSLCFGEQYDEDVIISEILAALSFGEDAGSSVSMNLREREKSANAVFTVMDVLRHWTEQEMEQRHQSPRSISKRAERQSRSGDPSSWPVDESISRIGHFMRRVPLSTCAIAASAVGMNARALRFLEIESRSKVLVNVDDDLGNDFEVGSKKCLKSEYLDGIDLELTQLLLGQLSDFDTMVVVAQKSHYNRSGLTRRLAEEAAERELYGGKCMDANVVAFYSSRVHLTIISSTTNRLGRSFSSLRAIVRQ